MTTVTIDESFVTAAASSSSIDQQVAEDLQAQRKRRRLSKITDLSLAIGTPIFILVLWEVTARMGVVDPRFFPAPTTIFEKLGVLSTNGELWSNTGISLRRLAIGFVVGVVPGIIIGVSMGLYRPIRSALKPLVSGTYPIPKSALLPLILLIFGMGETSKVVMVAIGVFYPVALNTASGVMNLDRVYYDVAKNFGASKWRVFRKVAIPGAMPSIMTGVELGAGLGLILIAIAEMVGAQSGLGFMIWNAWELYSVETMYVGLFVIAIIGYLLAIIIGGVGKLLMPWTRTHS